MSTAKPNSQILEAFALENIIITYFLYQITENCMKYHSLDYLVKSFEAANLDKNYW